MERYETPGERLVSKVPTKEFKIIMTLSLERRKLG